VRCGDEGEDGEDAVIAEAKPRTLRKRQPASQPVWLVLGLAGEGGRLQQE